MLPCGSGANGANTVQMQKDDWTIPILAGVIVTLIGLALRVCWEEIKLLRGRMHNHNKGMLKNDAKITILADRLARIDEQAHRKIIEDFEEIDRRDGER